MFDGVSRAGEMARQHSFIRARPLNSRHARPAGASPTSVYLFVKYPRRNIPACAGVASAFQQAGSRIATHSMDARQ